jgi:hypothetical protein
MGQVPSCELMVNVQVRLSVGLISLILDSGFPPRLDPGCCFVSEVTKNGTGQHRKAVLEMRRCLREIEPLPVPREKGEQKRYGTCHTTTTPNQGESGYPHVSKHHIR